MPLHGPRNFCGHLVQVAVVTLTQMNIISVARLLRMREHTRYVVERTLPVWTLVAKPVERDLSIQKVVVDSSKVHATVHFSKLVREART